MSGLIIQFKPFNAYCEPDMLSTRLVAAACIFSIMYVNCINVRYGTRLTDVFGKISITLTFY